MSRLRVLIDPYFRTMDEIFTANDLARLGRVADLVWAHDEPIPSDRFLAEVGSVDVVVFGTWTHGPAWLDLPGRPVAVLEVSGGHEHGPLDYDRALAEGVAIGSCAPAFGPVVAEHGLALALACRRGVVAADRGMRVGTERWLHAGNAANASLFGARIGFVGCGGISRHLQRLLAPFDVELLGYDPPMPTPVLEKRGIQPRSLEEIFSTADVIFVLAAPTPDNAGIINAELLAKLGPDRNLIVLSRASLVDVEELVAQSNARGFRFGIDVFPVEPLGHESPIRSAPNAVLSPHLAGALPVALQAIGRMVTDDIEAIADGRPPTAMQYLDTANKAGLRQTR